MWNYLLRGLSLGTRLGPNTEQVSLKKIPISFRPAIPVVLNPLAMDQKVMDIFLFCNTPLLLFLEGFKEAE